jgi:hypothetical protein
MECTCLAATAAGVVAVAGEVPVPVTRAAVAAVRDATTAMETRYRMLIWGSDLFITPTVEGVTNGPATGS